MRSRSCIIWCRYAGTDVRTLNPSRMRTRNRKSVPSVSTEYSRVNGSSEVSTETHHQACARFGWLAKIEKKMSVSMRFISVSEVKYTMLSA